MARFTRREVAGYFTGKSPEETTLADVRCWTKGAPRFNAEDPTGSNHGVSVPHDDWQRYSAYFKRHRGLSEPETRALAQQAWERATTLMEWEPIFDLMKQEAARGFPKR
jgi:hypothetical protein